MKTIDTYTWKPHPEKPGYVVVDRIRTTREIIDDVNESIPGEIRRELEYDFSDMADRSFGYPKKGVPFPEHRWIAVFPVTGGSEGYYIHIEAIRDDKRTLIGLAKCWDWNLAWKLAEHVARALEV